MFSLGEHPRLSSSQNRFDKTDLWPVNLRLFMKHCLTECSKYFKINVIVNLGSMSFNLTYVID